MSVLRTNGPLVWLSDAEAHFHVFPFLLFSFESFDIPFLFEALLFYRFSYKLVGQNSIADTLDDRQVTVNITRSDRIKVQPGDFIGMYCVVNILVN